MTSPSRPATDGLDRLLEHVRRAKQHVHDVRHRYRVAATNAVEHRLHLVRELGDDGVAHRRAHALDRVDGAEDRADGAATRRHSTRRARAGAAPG